VTEPTALPGTPPHQPQLPVSPLEPWPDSVTWRPVSRKLIVAELLRFALRLALLGLVVVVAVELGWPYPDQTLLALALYGLLRTLAIVRAVLAWGYAERERDLLVRHGLLIRRLSIVPYARMQFIDVTAGPVERVLGLATVQLHTAAAASDARVPGLPPAEASRLRDRLASLGEDLGEGL
jgi:hypothetical protein